MTRRRVRVRTGTSRRPVLCGLLALGALSLLASCERRPSPAARGPRPARTVTGLFLDRREPTDLRVVSYNVNFDKIFPDKDPRGAEKFRRVVMALDPDILNLQEIREKTAGDVVGLLNTIAPRAGTWHAHKEHMQVIISTYPIHTSWRSGDAVRRPASERHRGPTIALLDLPDSRFNVDVFVLNNHFKCCGGERNDSIRQSQADAVVSWVRDARTVGGAVDLPDDTPIIIAGDLNLVGGPQPLTTLLTGDIVNEAAYGPDFAPDWDGSGLADARPLHNAHGPADYTWRNDDDQWEPGRLDCVVYTDSVLTAVHAFVLNTVALADEDLARAGLERFDVTLDDVGRRFDHLPVVVDFRLVSP